MPTTQDRHASGLREREREGEHERGNVRRSVLHGSSLFGVVLRASLCAVAATVHAGPPAGGMIVAAIILPLLLTISFDSVPSSVYVRLKRERSE
jgi:hypothetical protein